MRSVTIDQLKTGRYTGNYPGPPPELQFGISAPFLPDPARSIHRDTGYGAAGAQRTPALHAGDGRERQRADTRQACSARRARSAASVTAAMTEADRHQCRSVRRANEKLFDHMTQSGIFGGHAAGEQVDYVGILPGKELLESLSIGLRRQRKVFIKVTQQQHVELAHPAPAPPAQLARIHRRRSTSMRLIEAIALAGLRSLGQAFVQFMIVWQRYRRNGSSR